MDIAPHAAPAFADHLDTCLGGMVTLHLLLHSLRLFYAVLDCAAVMVVPSIMGLGLGFRVWVWVVVQVVLCTECCAAMQFCWLAVLRVLP